MEPIKKQLSLVSVIIINWNGGEVFATCLKSLKKINYQNWELIVVDNGSSDNSENLVKLYKPTLKIKIIKNKQNEGFAKANNQGYKKSEGKYILLLNNDTKVTPDFLNILVEKMEMDNNLGVVQPKIYLMDKLGYLDNAGSFFTKIGFLHHWGFMMKDNPEFNKEKYIFSAKGACMLIRRKVIEEVGLFDNNFISYFEESDFCWRAWLIGYTVLFYPDAKIYHKLGFTIKRLDVLNLNYHYYKNRICSLIKNLGKENLIPILFAHILISCGIIILFIIRLQPKNSLIIIKAILWNLKNLKNNLNKRNKIQQKRKITDKTIFSQVSYPIKWKKYIDDFQRVENDLKQ